MSSKTPFVILSAESRDRSAVDNAEASSSLFDRLCAAGHEPMTVDGVYKGRPEESFLVLLPKGDSDPRYEELLDLAWLYGQSCILYVDGQRQAYFDHGPASKHEIVQAGRWCEIDGFGTLPDSYTVLPDGRYCGIV